ncbi:TPA: hypothetical protein DDW69_04770 [candidate division CPR2 bacterium]|uniref:ADP-ribose pyrophosphatase n=1 Tax=candidate division CPR2 bacterium GW2011_GWC1_41_48 TaxID=1618344 RepID=A0A0G0W8N8_UNCC2|nr:MAG: ADP-ribose pyrophosphatase [candidate division CPR2 bacterium GW2011_GWC2_39_35]KKR28305.1 MAG: ADP-ribose pyrophosphatase [candidate division CPR2 bacterium GW2011_GWD2_39_7]KKR28948.1 MAG: ADP-ribose pyrophosphatase [candidate division CPR2 bacterium GW2011_GWD1_39_7]KKS09359.1 MAG: ADP-ribose pyrophosphatase [candidate division CPR2 bacterium GW2011_GWC1_41_48]OGB61778.1 MAG: hypothetical protein A2Y27_03030 [candidate division CPR2 bacterium GWD1_39_7]OGB72447.1 MAG: hypothetical p
MDEILRKIGSIDEGVFAIFVNDNKEILKGFRNYPSGSVWTDPGGRCSGDETLESTLRREVFEEIGIRDFEIRDYLGKFEGGFTDVWVYMFYCRTREEPRNMEPDKFSNWKWMGIQEFTKTSVGKEYMECVKKLIQDL